jgi:hypothetical protein
VIYGIKSACALQLCERCDKYKPKTPHYNHKCHKSLLPSPLIILKTWTFPFEVYIYIYICVCVCVCVCVYYCHSSCCGVSLFVFVCVFFFCATVPSGSGSPHSRGSPAGFEPTISAGEQPQTHALDRAATGSGHI